MAQNPGQTNFIPGDILTASQYNTTNNTVDRLAIDDNNRIVYPYSPVPVGIVNGHWVLAALPGTYTEYTGSTEILTPSVFVYNSNTLTWATYPLYYGATGEVDLINYSDYVHHLAGEDFVYYKNASSTDSSFTVPFVYKCLINTLPGQSPETHPGKWERLGVYIDTVDVENRLDALELNNSALVAHLTDTANPHSVTKLQVGLSDVDNTTDMDKPISVATQNALNNKSDLGHTHTATTVTLNTTSFNNNLNGTVTNVQLLAEAVDELVAGGGGGATNLSYVASPTNGTVTSDTGTDATIPLVDVTNAGLISPSTNTNITNHLSATAGAHPASAITVAAIAGFAAITGQAFNSEIAAFSKEENIFFDDAATAAKVTRAYDFKVTAKTESGGTGTITTSEGAAYTLNATVSANDYVKVTASAVNTRVFLTIEKVIA